MASSSSSAALRTDSHAADPNQLLLDKHLQEFLYIPDKNSARIISKAAGVTFNHGKNYRIADHESSLREVLSDESTPGARLARTELRAALCSSLKLDRDKIKLELTGTHAPAHTKDDDAAKMLASPMLMLHRIEATSAGSKPAEKHQALTDLSAKNLAEMHREIERHKQMPHMAGCQKMIDQFVADVRTRYEAGVATHGTNNKIEGQIHCTADRERIEDFAVGFTGDKSAAKKMTHTSATNTQHLHTHEMVFFNVYPSTNPDMLAKQQATSRYLRVTPEVPSSAYSENARSFALPMSGLMASGDRLQVMTLRDPVYPSGGTTEAQAKSRMEQGGYATVASGAQPPGTALRKFGNEEDRYLTHQNLFVGANIGPALVGNVELGLYKTFNGLQAAAQGNPADDRCRRFFDQVQAANNATGADKDQRVMDVIKLYQYPQLMIAGSVDVRGVTPYVPTPQMIAESRKTAPGVSSGATVSAPVSHSKEMIEAALSGKKHEIFKKPEHLDVAVRYLDHMSKTKGEVVSVQFIHKKCLRATFAGAPGSESPGAVEEITPQAISAMKSVLERARPTESVSSPAVATSSAPAAALPTPPALGSTAQSTIGGNNENKEQTLAQPAVRRT